jgi:hypothetical protein
LKASLKNIKLQQITFEQKLFESFVRYISRDYFLEDFDLKDIWETDSKKEHEVIDPMSCWYDLRPTPASPLHPSVAGKQLCSEG